MNINIYIDNDGKVIISDLPVDLAKIVLDLRGERLDYTCDAITGFSVDELINKKNL